MNAKSENDPWQTNVSDKVHVFIIGATGACSEFNGNFHLDIQERGLKSCSWELPFVPKQQLYRAMLIANLQKNSTFDVWFKFEGDIQGPVWNAINISELSNTILLKLNPDISADKALSKGWPQHIRVSFSHSNSSQKTFYIPPGPNENTKATLSSLGMLGNSGGCPVVSSVTGSGGAQQSTNYPDRQQTSFTCNAESEVGATLNVDLVDGTGSCAQLELFVDGISQGPGCEITIMPPYSNRGAIITYQINCWATGETLWSGTVTFIYISGPTQGPTSQAPGDQPKTSATAGRASSGAPQLPNGFAPFIFPKGPGLPEECEPRELRYITATTGRRRRHPRR